MRSRLLLRYSAVMALLAAASAFGQAPSAAPIPHLIPHLEKRGQATQLIVDGRPFLMLGGELRNNSATSLKYMQPIWPKLVADHLNTVLAGVSWAQLEPAEGNFDFSTVDGLIRSARAHHLHLVLLWFGSWKNSWSSYAPDWVKRDFTRFPRVEMRDGSGTERLSPFSQANCEADAHAFAALMQNIREVDGQAHTVLMIQVENEVGVIPDARDHSPAANAAYRGPVPQRLMDDLQKHRAALRPYLLARWQAAGFRTSGTWEQVFGPGPETEDLFMAWHYARYIEKVAAAGKAEYPLPMYVNAALIVPGFTAGQYNSGGPLSHSLDIWRAAAPDLNLLAPDIYFNFEKWTAKYGVPGNPLFIPEAVSGDQGAAVAFFAFGDRHAIGFSPFSIDRMPKPAAAALAHAYHILSQLSPMILQAQTNGTVAAAMLEPVNRSLRVRLGDYTLNISRAAGFRPPVPAPAPSSPYAPSAPVPHAIFIRIAPDQFYIAGSDLKITFTPDTPGPPLAGLGTVEEGSFVDGRWVAGRMLAGDATGEGNALYLRTGPAQGILRVTVYRYK
jgi:hypothetical protein